MVGSWVEVEVGVDARSYEVVGPYTVEVVQDGCSEASDDGWEDILEEVPSYVDDHMDALPYMLDVRLGILVGDAYVPNAFEAEAEISSSFLSLSKPLQRCPTSNLYHLAQSS